MIEATSGPLPAPQDLARYDAVCPGAANRIITMAESQSNHRQTLEALALPAAIKAEERGQRNGLMISLAGLCVALALGLAGKELAAGFIGGGGLVSLAAVFVTGRRGQERERNESR